MYTHDESKAIKCDVCSKLFYNKSSFEIHYRTHTGEKPFACQICDRKFASKSNLSTHLKLHTKSKYTIINKTKFEQSLAFLKSF